MKIRWAKVTDGFFVAIFGWMALSVFAMLGGVWGILTVYHWHAFSVAALPDYYFGWLWLGWAADGVLGVVFILSIVMGFLGGKSLLRRIRRPQR